MGEPLVSIITPCYNGEQYLDRYFQSVLNQTYPNIELIFINDGSTDKTDEIVGRYQPQLEQRGIRFRYLVQENAGQAAALNRGLKLFSGEYLTWPDSDDEMTPDCIEKKVAYLQANPEVDLSVCKVAIVSESDPEQVTGLYEREKPQGTENFFEDMIYIRNVFFAPGGYMVRTKKLDAVLKNREIFTGRGGQNAQMLLPVSYDGAIGYMDDILYKYYVRESSHSHSIKMLHHLCTYEVILLETLDRMGSSVKATYEKSVRKFYAHRKYGTAVDTKDPKVIRMHFRNLLELKAATLREWLLFLKYGCFVNLFNHKNIGD